MSNSVYSKDGDVFQPEGDSRDSAWHYWDGRSCKLLIQQMTYGGMRFSIFYGVAPASPRG